MSFSFSNTIPMKNHDNDSSGDLDVDEYFSKPYVPLSNLPTPPMSLNSNGTSRQQSPEGDSDHGLDPDLLGPAIHLANLIPSSASLITPSVPIVHEILDRASLSRSTVALSAIILDSLNSRFALCWRRSLTPTLAPKSTSNKRFTHPYDKPIPSIDSLRPELIILSALIISVKFLDDVESSTQYYAERWGQGLWTCEQINATQMVVMENLGYRIMPLWQEQLIAEAEADMKLVGRLAMLEKERRRSSVMSLKFRAMEENKKPKSIDAKVAGAEVASTSPTSIDIELFPAYTQPGIDID